MTTSFRPDFVECMGVVFNKDSNAKVAKWYRTENYAHKGVEIKLFQTFLCYVLILLYKTSQL